MFLWFQGIHALDQMAFSTGMGYLPNQILGAESQFLHYIVCKVKFHKIEQDGANAVKHFRNFKFT